MNALTMEIWAKCILTVIKKLLNIQLKFNNKRLLTNLSFYGIITISNEREVFYMSELKEKGIKLEYKKGIFKLFIDGKFVVESEDLDYVLEYVKGKEILLNTETNIAELW